MSENGKEEDRVNIASPCKPTQPDNYDPKAIRIEDNGLGPIDYFLNDESLATLREKDAGMYENNINIKERPGPKQFPKLFP